LKVAVVTSFPDDPEAPGGGVEAVSVNLVKALAEFKDLDIDVITTRQDSYASGTESWGKVKIHRLPWAGGSMLRNAVGPGRRQMQEYLSKIEPDIIHAHDTYGLLVKGLALPRVFTIHGFIYTNTMFSGTRFSWLRSKIWKYIETSGWADQPHIISISPVVREHLTGIAAGVVYDIENPVNERCFEIKRRECKGRIFSAAKIYPLKNTLGLIKSFGKLIQNGFDCELRLAGGIRDESYMQTIRKWILSSGLTDHVHLLGNISTEQIWDELSSATVFALVSLDEGSPMGIEEAMAAGVPVVASNRCGMPYMVRDGESGFLVDPNNPDDIARRLGQLLMDDKLCRSLGAKGKEIALDRFHPAKVAARTREVYLRAIQDFQ